MARQGNSPASAPNSSRQRGPERGKIDRSTPGHPSSHNGQTSLRQTTLVHSTSVSCGTGTTTSRDQGQSSQGVKDRQEGTANRMDPTSLQCFRCQGWGNMAQECPTPPVHFKPVQAELRECGPTLHCHRLQQPTVAPSIPSLTPDQN